MVANNETLVVTPVLHHKRRQILLRFAFNYMLIKDFLLILLKIRYGWAILSIRFLSKEGRSI